ncbi:MAG: hypothetical protein D6679_02130 [Candidatus Hydrogenedentota bacterium]|nr:MAG: hypothetical protein D6679_02130 [Candidatus Hydrogenedentota bacterium]
MSSALILLFAIFRNPCGQFLFGTASEFLSPDFCKSHTRKPRRTRRTRRSHGERKEEETGERPFLKA